MIAVIKDNPEREGVMAPSGRRIMFGRDNEYCLEFATTIEQRRRAWALAYEIYADKGYAGSREDRLWYGSHDALPDTRTLIVSRDGVDVACMTLVFDSLIDLPADQVYGEELDQLRSSGRYLCEIISLVSRETGRKRSIGVLQHMFRAAFLVARDLEKATDFIITVNPRHAGYYRSRLLFEVIGELRNYEKVGGAPALLLRLDLETAEERYSLKYGCGENSLISFFLSGRQDFHLMRLLLDSKQELSLYDIKYWFEDHRKLLQQVSTEARNFILGDFIWSRPAGSSGEQEKVAEQFC